MRICSTAMTAPLAESQLENRAPCPVRGKNPAAILGDEYPLACIQFSLYHRDFCNRLIRPMKYPFQNQLTRENINSEGADF
jgi:hypothetical protein